MIAKKVIFSGKVQGVGFRYSVKQIALGFDIVGIIKNLSDGTVELQVMAEEEEVTEFISEITDESELVGLIKEHTIWDINPLEGCRGFQIT